MRSFVLAVLALFLASALPAEVSIVARAPGEPAPEVAPRTDGPRRAGKVDAPSTVLFLPFFEVDILDPAGTTTLFAVTNIQDVPTTLTIHYLSESSVLLVEETGELAPRETFTRNVRDVEGLTGVPSGYALLIADAPIIGDYFQVDVGDDFATGERLVTRDDLCQTGEIRYLDFGSGTELRFLIDEPQGNDPETDPPSFSFDVFDEAGTVVASFLLFTDQHAFPLAFDGDILGGLASGNMVFDFSTAGGGLVYAEYAAEGRFSVGVNGACTAP